MEPTEENLRAWDAIRRSRAEPTIPDPVRALLPDLRSKHVLQLVCGTGAASAELAALGAFVTGVDSSEEALDVARKRAANAVFVKADFRALPAELFPAGAG